MSKTLTCVGYGPPPTAPKPKPRHFKVAETVTIRAGAWLTLHANGRLYARDPKTRVIARAGRAEKKG